MNVERLYGLIEKLLETETKERTRKKLNAFVDTLNALAGSPQDTAQQQTYTTRRDELLQTLRGPALNDLSAGEWRGLEQLKADWLRGQRLADEIENLLDDVNLLPAVAHTHMVDTKKQFDQWIEALERIQSGFKHLEIPRDELKPGQAEIGFLLPSVLYDGDLPGLADELSELNQALKHLVEALNGTSPEDIRINDIAASDPTFFLDIDLKTIQLIGDLIKWSIDTIKHIIELRKSIKEMKENPSVSGEAIEILERDAGASGDKLIKQKSAEIMQSSPVKDEGRRNELTTAVEVSVREIVGRVERGMVVEIRYLPAQPVEVAEGETPPPPQSDLSVIANISRSLVFPAPPATPIISLPSHAKNETASGNKKRRKR